MAVRDSRKRAVKDSTGRSQIFKLRRLKCYQCGQIHVELPDFITPQKHYSGITIAAVVGGECDYCAADDSTIYRWKRLK